MPRFRPSRRFKSSSKKSVFTVKTQLSVVATRVLMRAADAQAPDVFTCLLPRAAVLLHLSATEGWRVAQGRAIRAGTHTHTPQGGERGHIPCIIIFYLQINSGCCAAARLLQRNHRGRWHDGRFRGQQRGVFHHAVQAQLPHSLCVGLNKRCETR